MKVIKGRPFFPLILNRKYVILEQPVCKSSLVLTWCQTLSHTTEKIPEKWQRTDTQRLQFQDLKDTLSQALFLCSVQSGAWANTQSQTVPSDLSKQWLFGIDALMGNVQSWFMPEVFLMMSLLAVPIIPHSPQRTFAAFHKGVIQLSNTNSRMVM